MFQKYKSVYEKTIAHYAHAYQFSYSYSLSADDEIGIASLLNVDVSLLRNSLHDTPSEINTAYDENTFTVEHYLFLAIIHSYFIHKDMAQLIFDSLYDESTPNTCVINVEAIRENIDIFVDALHHFEMLNTELGTFECMSRMGFSSDYTLYTNADFNLKNEINARYCKGRKCYISAPVISCRCFY